MIDFLLGVPGKLKTISDHLLTYWTSTRAEKLDLLTVAPAPASTALTNATWTDARAGMLDSVIKSVQTGSMDTAIFLAGGPVNVTITSVNVSKCIVLFQDRYPGKNVTAYLTSATNLRFDTLENSVTPAYTRWTVVEFK